MLSNFVGASTEKKAMKPRILPSGGELLNNIGAVPAVLCLYDTRDTYRQRGALSEPPRPYNVRDCILCWRHDYKKMITEKHHKTLRL